MIVYVVDITFFLLVSPFFRYLGPVGRFRLAFRFDSMLCRYVILIEQNSSQ